MASERLERLRQTFVERGLDGGLIRSGAGLRYFFGFTGSNGLAVVLPDRVVFFTDRRYETQAADEVAGAEVVTRYRNLFQGLETSGLLAEKLQLGFEADVLTFSQANYLFEKFPGVRWEPLEGLVAGLTEVKTPEEIATLESAAQICCQVFEELKPRLHAGLTERQVAAMLQYELAVAGCEGQAFEPIVASGPRSALPHAQPTHRALREGDFLILDFGCRIDGYTADFTRTLCVGKPTQRQREVYEAVRLANELAIREARPGLTGGELDALVRDFLRVRGFDEEFNHGLGHGLGLDVHGLPRVTKDSRDALRPGHVFTIEPGVYLPGWGGVRIEDDVVLEEDGARVLTPAPKELFCVAA